MTGPARPHVCDEVSAFFSAGTETLFGVFTPATAGGNASAVTMLTGGGYITSTHRNRAYVRLARRLSGLGYHAFRFDYHGTGESTGIVDAFSLERPFVDDLRGALDWLESRGLDRHVLVGSCFGSRTALSLAPEVAGLEALVLVSPPVLDAWWDPVTKRRIYVTGVGDGDGTARVEVSPNFLEPFRAVVRREVPVLVLFGTDEDLYGHFREALAGELGHVLEDAGPLVDVRTLPGHVQGFTTVGVQDEVLGLVVEWLGQRAPGVTGR